MQIAANWGYRSGFGCMALAMAICSPAAAAKPPVTDIRQIAMDEHATCAVTKSGALRCAGDNSHGQLGQGNDRSYVRFAKETLASGVTAVSMGGDHACAIVADSLQCWGANDFGQVGGGKVGVDVTRPLQIIRSGVTAVSAGRSNTCAVVSGALYCWGRNNEGEVGNGSPSNAVSRPVKVIASGVTAVASGSQHTCAVVAGDLKCWGLMLDWNAGGLATFWTPTTFIAGGVTAVAASLHTCAVVHGALQCWGRNFSGQVGVEGGARVSPRDPTEIIAKGVTDIVVDEKNTCAIAQSALYCWGDNSGQLGLPPGPSRDRPIPMIPGGVSAVSVGMTSICAVVEGTLRCTNRAPDEDAPPQDWLAFGSDPTPFSAADAPRLEVYGVWRGTLGNQEVMVDLEPKACTSSYFYLRHLWGIALVENGKRATIWRESTKHSTATWTVEAVTATALSGTWSDRDGRRRLPIRLKKIGTVKNDACNDVLAMDAFNAPRIDALQVISGAAKFENRIYKTLALFDGNILAAEILPSPQPVPALNRFLVDWQKSKIKEYFGCQTVMGPLLDATNPKPDFSAAMVPVFWNEHVLVLRETYSEDCGGAHSSGGIAGYVTWDLPADKPVEPWDWIRGGRGKYGGHVAPKKLNELLYRLYVAARGQGDPECGPAIAGNEYYSIYPGATGMVFSPNLAHAVQACADDIVVPYGSLRPYLTPAGAEALKAEDFELTPP